MKARLFVSFFALSLAAGSVFAKKSEPPPATPSVQSDVDAKMQQVVRSVDRSLSTLVTASRGGSVQRMPEPMGSTVAGPVTPPPAETLSSAAALDKKVDIQWNGSARALLDGLSKKIGYRFAVTGNPGDPTIKLMAKQMPVRNILDMVAAQLHGSSDIVVSTSQSQITLAGRSK